MKKQSSIWIDLLVVLSFIPIGVILTVLVIYYSLSIGLSIEKWITGACNKHFTSFSSVNTDMICSAQLQEFE